VGHIRPRRGRQAELGPRDVHDHGFLQDVVIFLAAAVVLVTVFQRLRSSPILGYLVAGVLIGPDGLGFITDVSSIRALAELGVVFLLFSIGLELSFNRLKVLRYDVFGLGTAQFAITALIIGGLAYGVGLGLQPAIVLGTGLALSSTAVVLQLLAERGDGATRMGRTTFSILLLQDLAAVPLLAMVPLLGGAQSTEWSDVAQAVGIAVAAVAGIIVGGRMGLRPLFRTIIASGPSSEVFVALTLLTVLGIGWASEQVGLSLTLGAFLAGLLLSETEFRHQVEAEIRPFQGLFMGLFFMSIGMGLNLGLAAEEAGLIVALVLALILGKAAIIVALCRGIGLQMSVAVPAGLYLAQGGEFAFILIGGAAESAVVPEEVAQIAMVVVGISMALTPFLAMAGRWLKPRLETYEPVGLAALEAENIDLAGHVVIAGFGRVGRSLASLLEAHRIPYVALERDPATVRKGREKGLPIYFADVSQPEILWGVGADRARAVVITINDREKALQTVELLHAKLPDLPILARAADPRHGRALSAAGAQAIVPEVLEVSAQLGAGALRAVGLSDDVVNRSLSEFRERIGVMQDEE